MIDKLVDKGGHFTQAGVWDELRKFICDEDFGSFQREMWIERDLSKILLLSLAASLPQLLLTLYP